MTMLIGATGIRGNADDWRTASREPVGLAPDPALVKEAMVQVYGARSVGAKGLFGVHTWVAVKPSNAPEWTVYEVVGWRLRSTGNAVVVRNRAPDGRWFGEMPELYAQKRGAGVDELIARIEQAAHAYPYAQEYRAWPGPNSNTFTAWIGRTVPELEMDLPATAIGKDYLGSTIFGTAPSGSGFQLSLGGMFGFAASGVDGVELNVLGLNFGVSPNGLKLPVIGRIGSFTPEDAIVELQEAVTAPVNTPSPDPIPAMR
jgi:predicted RNase H-like HicB family nuclease